MQAWGKQHCLTDKEIMNALEENMYHDGGSQRFSLETDQSGAVHISVHKRHQRWPQQNSGGDSWKQTSGDSWKQNGSSQSNNHWQDRNSRWDAGSAAPSSCPVDTSNVATPNSALNLWGSGKSDALDARGVWEESSNNDSWKKDAAEVKVGMWVTVTKDLKAHEKECKASNMSWPNKNNGEARTTQLGQCAEILQVSGDKVQLSNGVNWVPLRSLEGHDNQHAPDDSSQDGGNKWWQQEEKSSQPSWDARSHGEQVQRWLG